MFTKQKAILLFLMGFCGCLRLNYQSKIEKVVASEVSAVWEQATTIVSGNEYLITAESEGVTYLLPTGTNTTLINGHVLNFTEANTNFWIFTIDEGKYQIVDTNNNILYANGSIVTQRILASNNIDGVDEANRFWTLENDTLKSGNNSQWTISFEPKNNNWFSKSHEDRKSNLKFYTLITNGYSAEASSFSAWIMGQPDGDIATSQCSAKYQTAKEKWNELTPEAQELFQSSPSFNEARLRLTMWAVANGETIADFYDNYVAGVRNEKVNNSGIVFTLFSSILLFSGLLLSKKTKVKE